MQTRPDIYGLDKTTVDLLKRVTPCVDVPIAGTMAATVVGLGAMLRPGMS